MYDRFSQGRGGTYHVTSGSSHACDVGETEAQDVATGAASREGDAFLVGDERSGRITIDERLTECILREGQARGVS
jgi:hypothetical protein